MTNERFGEVGQALDDFFDGIDTAKDAVATLQELMVREGYITTADGSFELMSQALRYAEAALEDARICLARVEPSEDVFDDE